MAKHIRIKKGTMQEASFIKSEIREKMANLKVMMPKHADQGMVHLNKESWEEFRIQDTYTYEWDQDH